ncbi:MAG: hypothetical protein J0I48_20360 [Devosia sp.]|uniref:hypothetical protein n=1 Tax=Devosia sp. 66-22 TaxID=1895753 RepID=UPI001ACA7958|nr:hypothetical protein [Devosia sp. 66-22]MBN9348523.1 hypothetical protein [Devosia sp.]
MKTMLVVASTAVTMVACSLASAQAAMRDLMPDKIAVIVIQEGEERCYVDIEEVEKAAARSFERNCGFEAVGRDETDGRFYIRLNWTLASVLETGAQVNVCNSPGEFQIGYRKKYSELQPSKEFARDGYAVVEVARNFGSVLHQMNAETRRFVERNLEDIADDLPGRFCAAE